MKDSDNEAVQTKDYDSKELFTNTDSEDISDGISVITESDTDAVNTNLLQICQFNHKLHKSLQMPEEQVSRHRYYNNYTYNNCNYSFILFFIQDYILNIFHAFWIIGFKSFFYYR